MQAGRLFLDRGTQSDINGRLFSLHFPMNAQLNQLEDRLDRWMEEPFREGTDVGAQREIVVIANLLKSVVYNLKLIDARLEAAEGTARRAANDASCLANGILPD